MIKKQLLPTFIAFVVMMLLAVYANYFETSEILREGMTPPEPLVEGDFDEIRSVEFLNGESKGLKMVKEKGKTARIVSPENYLADPALSGNILSSLANLQSEVLIATETARADIYGLNASSTVISVVTDKGTYELTFGNKMEIADSYYIMRKGVNKIYGVHGKVKTVFNTKLNDLRDKHFYEEDFGNATEIQYKNVSADITLASLTGKEWVIQSPENHKAENSKVMELLSNIQQLKVVRFIENEATDLTIYGLDKPSLEIRIKGVNGKERIVKAGFDQGNEVYVCADGKAVHAANKSDVDKLRLTLSDLRDKKLEMTEIGKITEISLKDATGTITLTANADKWKKGEEFVNAEKVKSFIGELANLKVSKFDGLSDLESKGLKDTSNSPYIEIKTNELTNKWYFGNKNNPFIWLGTDKETIEVPTDIAEKFNDFVNSMRNL